MSSAIRALEQEIHRLETIERVVRNAVSEVFVRDMNLTLTKPCFEEDPDYHGLKITTQIQDGLISFVKLVDARHTNPPVYFAVKLEDWIYDLRNENDVFCGCSPEWVRAKVLEGKEAIEQKLEDQKELQRLKGLVAKANKLGINPIPLISVEHLPYVCQEWLEAEGYSW